MEKPTLDTEHLQSDVRGLESSVRRDVGSMGDALRDVQDELKKQKAPPNFSGKIRRAFEKMDKLEREVDGTRSDVRKLKPGLSKDQLEKRLRELEASVRRDMRSLSDVLSNLKDDLAKRPALEVAGLRSKVSEIRVALGHVADDVKLMGQKPDWADAAAAATWAEHKAAIVDELKDVKDTVGTLADLAKKETDPLRKRLYALQAADGDAQLKEALRHAQSIGFATQVDDAALSGLAAASAPGRGVDVTSLLSPGRPGAGRSSAEVADALEHHQRIRGTNTLKEGPKAGGDDDDDDSARSAGRRPSRAAGSAARRASRARSASVADRDSRRASSAARGSAVGFRVRKNTAALNAAAVVTAAVHEEEKVEVVDEAKMRQRQITRYAPQYAQSKTSRFRRQGVDADTQDAYRDDNDVFVDTYSTAKIRKGHRARGVVDLGNQKEGPKRGPKKAAKTREQIAGRRGGGLFAGKAVGVVVGSAGGGKLAGTGQMVGPGAFRRAGGVRGGLS